MESNAPAARPIFSSSALRQLIIPLIIEHLDLEDIPRAKGFVDATLRRVGV